ncbi:MAG: DUF4184 family protein [Pseudomonadota bacterium]
MPFTVSHVAAVVPLQRMLGARTSFSALAIGAMVPDLGYYVQSWTLAVHLHSLEGAVTTGIAIGLCLFLLYHWLVRPAYVRLLPRWVSSRLEAEAWRRGWPSREPMWAVLVCLAIGTLTHIGWDSFTHPRAGSLWGDWFAAPVFAEQSLPRYVVLQHLSTIAGAVALLVGIGLWARATPAHLSPAAAPHGVFGHPLLPLTVVVVPALVGFASAAASLSGVRPVEEFLVLVAYFGGACVLALGLVTGVLVPLLGLGERR